MTTASADAAIATLDALVAATGTPPDDAEPEVVLAAYAAIETARAELLAELAATAAAARGDARLPERIAALAASDRAWMDALSRARSTVDQRIGAVRRTARYAR